MLHKTGLTLILSASFFLLNGCADQNNQAQPKSKKTTYAQNAETTADRAVNRATSRAINTTVDRSVDHAVNSALRSAFR